MAIFEYKALSFAPGTLYAEEQRVLKQQGAEGWELVAVVDEQEPRLRRYYFKRTREQLGH